MTQETAVVLIRMYDNVAKKLHLPPVVSEIMRRYDSIVDPSEGKTMRWLGFCQGFMACEGVFTLDQLKDHSRNPGNYDIDGNLI